MFHRSPASGRPGAPQRGSVLLVILLFITVLGLTVSGFSAATGSTMEQARDNNASLQAELMAESALAFAMRQLVLDEDWAGTGSDPVALAGSGFEVEVLGETADGGILLRTTGVDGSARAMLQAEVLPEPGGGAAKTSALVTYGGALDMNGIVIPSGDALVVDDNAGVLDWNFTLEDWIEPAIPDPAIVSNGAVINGILYGYKNTFPGITAADRVKLTEPVRTPVCDLDAFLVPNPDSIITTSTSIKNWSTSKTVVVVALPGQHIQIENSLLRGGLVVWCEDNRTARQEPRNTLEWNGSSFGSAIPSGSVPHLGVLAPGCQVTDGNTMAGGYGLFLIHSSEDLNTSKILGGALMVLNHTADINSYEITFDPSIWDGSLDPYLDFGNSTVSLTSVQEYYPEP